MDNIIILDYDPNWPQLFEQEASRLREVLTDLVVSIEHFGSTSVPGLAAKPIIDILVVTYDLEAAKQQAVEPLEGVGYRYWRDDPNPNHMLFVRGLPPRGPRTHHVHLVESNFEWCDRILFRDYLRNNPQEAARYVQLKRDLAQRFPTDREAYTEGKTEFVQSILQLCLNREKC